MRGIRIFAGGAISCCLLVFAWSGRVGAEPISLTMANGLTANAEYRAGQPDKPAILLLHGFLQTHNFPTVFRLTESLHGEGYTVLAPTLTLGVPNRRQSMACEAIHTHTLASDADEIKVWLDWLLARRRQPVVLIGHSTGSLELLNFFDSRRHPGVVKLIGISLVEARMEIGPKERARLITELRKQSRQKEPPLLERQVSFCKQFRASPASLLSFLEWTPERILATIKRLRLPQAYVMGDHDSTLGLDWLPRLGATGQRMHIIKGANHFMDGEHEFELLDEVLSELRRPLPSKS